MQASVIIPHYNMPDALARCLASVTAQIGDAPIEVIVVDNASPAPPHDVVAGFPGVRLLMEPVPGPGLARNTGAAAASGAILVFIDADCRAQPGWLAAAIAAARARGPAGAVGGDISIEPLDPDQPTAIECYESLFGFRQKRYIHQNRFSCTANLAMHRDVLARIGPFAGIGVAEDVDWGHRAHAAGLPITFAPAMRVTHPARPRLQDLLAKWQRHVAHAWATHVAGHRPAWRWLLPMALMLPSVLVDGARLIVLAPIGTLRQRLGAVGVLAMLRWQRARWMWAWFRGSGSDAVDAWRKGA